MTTTPKTLTVTECHQLLDALLCKQGTKKQFRKGIRNYTIALLMLEAGLRVGEVVALLITDLWFQSLPVTSIIISAQVAKSGRERQIPVSERLSNAIKETAESCWSQRRGEVSLWAFCRENSPLPLTTRQVERIIRAAAEKSIGRPVHPHVLRHTFASRLMRKTNARIVQELLGHQSMTSTQIYTHPNEDDKKKAIGQLNEPALSSQPGRRGLPACPDAANSCDAARTNQHHS